MEITSLINPFAQAAVCFFGNCKISDGVAAAALNANDLHHIFDNPRHKLGPVLEHYGSREAAGAAVESSAQAALGGTEGICERVTIQVGEFTIGVSGRVMG